MNTPRFAAICALALWIALADTLPAADLPREQRQWIAAANRHTRHGWVYVHLEGGPRQRGFQHGHLLAREIAEELRVTRVCWEHQNAVPWSDFVAQIGARFTSKIDAENLAELDGLVEGMQTAGVASSRAEMIAYNGWMEFAGYWWPQEFKKLKDAPVPPVRESCSSFIAVGGATADRGVVLGHNSMTPYNEALPYVIADVAPDRGHRILMQTWPGWIHSGTDFFVTDAGLVGSETTIGGFEGFDPDGIPEFARMRRATQDADSIDQWCAIMKRGNNGGYANAWLLGDIHRAEIARLELGLKHIGFERTTNGLLLGSNIAEDLKLLRFETTTSDTDIRCSNVARRVRWRQLMVRHAGRIDLALAKRFEADHFDPYFNRTRAGGRSLCGHYELDREPAGPWPGVPFGLAGTVDAKVIDTTMAKNMSFAARWGSACGRAFDARRFLADHPQFEWTKDILRSRPTQPWTTFRAGETR
jgi:hypothetical protein